MYNKLPIKKKQDIDIKPQQICEILNKKPGLFLKEILNDIEINILNNKLNNEFNAIKKYIISKYK